MTAQNENCGFSPVTFSEYTSLKIFLTVFLILLFPKVFPMVFPDKKNGRLWLLEPPTNGFTVCRRVFSLPPTYQSSQVHKSTCRTRFRGYSSHRSTPPPTRLLEREKKIFCYLFPKLHRAYDFVVDWAVRGSIYEKQ